MRKNGDGKEGHRTRQFNIRFSDDEFNQLEELSRTMGLEMASVVRRLVARAHGRLSKAAIRKLDALKKDNERTRRTVLE